METLIIRAPGDAWADFLFTFVYTPLQKILFGFASLLLELRDIF